MGARRYSASTGRFLQVDLYSDALDNLGLSADPLAQNRYALAGANPINFVEIDGHRVAPVIDDGGGWFQRNLPFTTCVDFSTCTSSEPGRTLGGDLRALATALYVASGAKDAVDCAGGSASSCAWTLAGLTAPGRAARLARGVRVAEDGVSASRIWSKSEFRGQRVYQMKKIDLKRKDLQGRTNLERMRRGLAPIGPDGKPINLHHLTQDRRGPLAEVTQTTHQRYSKILHINANSAGSAVDRREFAKFRRAYWKARHGQLGGKG